MVLKKIKVNKEFIRYFLFFFLFVALYNIIFSGFPSREDNIFKVCFYMLDYSFGFCTRFFPGAVYHLFFKEVTYWRVCIFCIIELLLIFALVAMLFAKLMCLQKNVKMRSKMWFLFLFFLSGPCTFSGFWISLGLYDMYWFLFTAVFLLLVSKKYWRVFVPILFLLCVTIQLYNSLLYILLFGVILLYEALQHKGRERNIYLTMCVLGVISSILLTVYFMLFEKSNLTYTWDEALQVLKQRDKLGTQGNFFYQYFGYHYYDKSLLSATAQKSLEKYLIDPANTTLPAWLVKIFNLVIYYFFNAFYFNRENLLGHLTRSFTMIAICLPLLICFYQYWVCKTKQEKRFVRKLPYILSMVPFPLSCCMLVILTDAVRILSHGFMVSFVLFIYFMHKENDWQEWKNSIIMQADKKFILLYFLCYIFIVFSNI